MHGLGRKRCSGLVQHFIQACRKELRGTKRREGRNGSDCTEVAVLLRDISTPRHGFLGASKSFPFLPAPCSRGSFLMIYTAQQSEIDAFRMGLPSARFVTTSWPAIANHCQDHHSKCSPSCGRASLWLAWLASDPSHGNFPHVLSLGPGFLMPTGEKDAFSHTKSAAWLSPWKRIKHVGLFDERAISNDTSRRRPAFGQVNREIMTMLLACHFIVDAGRTLATDWSYLCIVTGDVPPSRSHHLQSQVSGMQ